MLTFSHFNNLWNALGFGLLTPHPRWSARQAVAVEARDGAEGTTVEIALPRVKPADCSVWTEGRQIKISTPAGAWSFDLTDAHDASAVSAALQDGVLQVFAPKRELEKRQIEIGTQLRPALPALPEKSST